MYRDSTDTIGLAVQYKKVLKGIKEGNWRTNVENLHSTKNREDYSTAKRLLPSVIFSGTFTERNADSLKEYAKMIVIDIDKLLPEQIVEYKEAFKGDQHVHVFFVSPSKKGLKLLIKLQCEARHHLGAFLSLEKYFKDTYGIQIDKSGKDVSRLCYVSYDPEMYHNEESTAWTFDIEEAMKDATSSKRGFDDRPDKFKGHVLSKDAKYIFGVCEKWTQRNVQYESGGRNNYIHMLSCNMNRVGVDIMDAALMVYNNYSDLPFKEIDTTINSAYRNKQEHNTVDVYEVEKGVIPDEAPDLTDNEMVIYDDTIDMIKKGVEGRKITKYFKSYGRNNLQLTFERVAEVMKIASDKMKEVEKKSSMKIESLKDSILGAIAEYKDTGGVSTLIPDFDHILNGGYMPGNLYELIGVGGSFKSIYSICVGIENAKSGSLTLYLSGEMSRLQLIDKIINKELNVELMDGLKNKTITNDSAASLIENLGQLLLDFNIVNGSGWTQDMIIKTVNDIEGSTGKKVTLIIVDGLTQCEDVKRDEIKSAIHNSGMLKEVAKLTNAAVVTLIHTSGGISKHTRNTSKFCRGGDKVCNNADAMLCTSMLIDESSSNMEEGDLLYRQGIFYMRLIDKRGSGLVESKILQVHRPLRLEPLTIDPQVMEVSLKQ